MVKRVPNKVASQQGFTLIELSIVLVIIGLIVGGILVGQDLIKAAQLRATITQLERYDAAVNTFRSKFGGLPGDMANGANFFAAADVPGSTATNCAATSVIPGDGIFEDCAGDARITLTGETLGFWRQLNVSNLIGETITQSTAITDSTATPTVANFPPAKIGNGNYVFVYTGANTLTNTPGMSGNNLYRLAGLTSIAAGAPVFNTALTPLEAFQIDSKKDDGLPQTGIVQETDTITAATFNVTADSGSTGNGKCIITGGTAYNTGTTNAVQNTRICELVIRTSF